jgi:hypothetical protein
MRYVIDPQFLIFSNQHPHHWELDNRYGAWAKFAENRGAIKTAYESEEGSESGGGCRRRRAEESFQPQRPRNRSTMGGLFLFFDDITIDNYGCLYRSGSS